MKVKICGVTHPDDATLAVQLGADYIGIIFHPNSKRNVTLAIAKSIAETIKKSSAELVGVFVDQESDQIRNICNSVGIQNVQLHGVAAQRGMAALLNAYHIIYAVVSSHTPLPSSVTPLYDSPIGGSGIPFDWNAFAPPENREWILAGGLNSGNVADAIQLLKPSCVDVSTGVEIPGMARKDPQQMRAFIHAAKK